ncbi:MAG: DUF1499 domain-containing protein [Pseudomonadota bacterium]
MKLLGLLILLALLGVVAFLVFVRVAPDKPAEAHIDPVTDGRTTPASYVLRAPQALAFATTPEALFDTANAYILSELNARSIANGPQALHVTYVVRSRVFRFPDDLSIRAVDVGGGAVLAVHSRSRYAGYDWGVNRKRVEALMDHLAMTFPAAP